MYCNVLLLLPLLLCVHGRFNGSALGEHKIHAHAAARYHIVCLSLNISCCSFSLVRSWVWSFKRKPISTQANYAAPFVFIPLVHASRFPNYKCYHCQQSYKDSLGTSTMARITARQAYTRAKLKRERRRHDLDKAMIEARDRYIRQLSDIGILVQDENTDQRSRPTRTNNNIGSNNKRSPGLKRSLTQNTKITDFFAVLSRGRDNVPKFQACRRSSSSKLNVTSSLGQNAIEVITIDDSETETCDDNNNNSNQISKHCDLIPQQIQSDVKPFQHLNISNLGTSFEELNLKVKVDEDIEIVEMLPPIPLRNHPVFELEED